MKYYIENLAIEVTRKCNMNCAHCLRGDAQNMNIDTDYIDALLVDVSGIGNVTFTGGEPSLNIQAIEYTLEKCKELDIPVCSFYIVTNGKENALPLALACLKWYAYCEDDEEMCGLAMSRDKFHDNVGVHNESILRGLKFFREDKFTDFNRVNIINEGRAAELSGYYKVLAECRHEEFSYDWNGDTIYIETMVYLSANGEIRTDCDIAYNNEDYTIGNVGKDSFNYIMQMQIIEKDDVLPI